MWERFKELSLKLEGQYDETISDHVRYPLYTDNFEDALRTIFLDILRRKELRNAQREMEFDDYFRETENIFAFLGARGAGKTTAMEEFCRILKRLSNQRELEWWLEHVIPETDIRDTLKGKKFNFHVFPRMDVSMMENKEDLFEVIMTNILAFYQSIGQHCLGIDMSGKRQEEIIELFDEILRGYYAIRDSREEEYVDSYIVKLQYVSKSLELQKKIDELTQKILQYKDGKYSEEYQNYFVIVVDDLDLNIEHGFEMLKQLQKYFSSSHILIVFSADYEQLNEICWVHFMKAFSSEKSHVIEQEVKDKCRELGRDYIGKALPISKRLHMPDLNNGTREVRVLDSSLEVTVKQYVMMQIARKMKIYYDIKGKKRHYIEPDNIRRFVNYYNLLEELYVIDYDAWEKKKIDCRESQIYMEQYDQNHERINKDIENRLVNNLLSSEQKKEFEQWLQIRLERRPESACILMKKETTPNPMDTERRTDMDVFLKQPERAERLNAPNDPTGGYSYGEFLQQIYKYGRIQPQNKAYVKCLLASLTSEMVREKICFSRNPNQQKREEAKYALLGLVGKSFGNSWLGEMMPTAWGDSGFKNLGFPERGVGINISEYYFQFPQEIFGLNEIKSWRAIQKIIQSVQNVLAEEKFVCFVEWVTAFLNLPGILERQEFFPFELTIAQGKNIAKKDVGEKQHVLRLKFEHENLYCGILEFIPKTLDFPEYLEILHTSLNRELTETIAAYLGDISPDIKKKIKNSFQSWIKKQSIFVNDRKTIRPIFPFYQIDFSYNVLKRARRELLEENSTVCEMHEWFSYVKKVYKKIIEKMKEEERAYEEIGIEMHYSERFAQFPIVKEIIANGGDSNIHGKIKEYLLDMFYREDESFFPPVYIEEE